MIPISNCGVFFYFIANFLPAHIHLQHDSRYKAVQGIPTLHLLSNTSNLEVVIVGAGPSGLLLGLRLGRENIDVTILDLSLELDTKPCATHYASAAVQELNKGGVLDDIRAMGFTPTGTCWRKIDGTYLAGLKNAVV